MLIPYGTDRPLRRPTLVTYALMAANIAVHLVLSIIARTSPDRFEQLEIALWLDPETPRWWGFITYQFLHGGLMHLGANMLFLYVFGPNVEDRMKRLPFLGFYLLGGIAAGGAHCLFETPIALNLEGSVTFIPPVVGASGSIAAVTGAYIVLFPKTTVKVLSLLFIIGTFSIPAWCLILFAIVKDLFFHGAGASDGVALAAHLGGYTFGIASALILLWVKVLPREPYDLFSMGRQAHRRRTFKELTSAGKTPWLAQSPSVLAPAGTASPQQQAQLEQLARARSEISRLLGEDRIEEAGNEYLVLLDHSHEAVMGRDAQIQLANHFYASGRYQNARVAYELFTRKFANDRESPRVHLMLAVISGRYLNDPVGAKRLLAVLRDAPLEAELRGLAQELETELG